MKRRGKKKKKRKAKQGLGDLCDTIRTYKIYVTRI